jgi:hypothetical protein
MPMTSDGGTIKYQTTTASAARRSFIPSCYQTLLASPMWVTGAPKKSTAVDPAGSSLPSNIRSLCPASTCLDGSASYHGCAPSLSERVNRSAAQIALPKRSSRRRLMYAARAMGVTMNCRARLCMMSPTLFR